MLAAKEFKREQKKQNFKLRHYPHVLGFSGFLLMPRPFLRRSQRRCVWHRQSARVRCRPAINSATKRSKVMAPAGCRRFGLRDFIFSIQNGGVGGFKPRLDFWIFN